MKGDLKQKCKEARIANRSSQNRSIEPLPIVRGLILVFIRKYPKSTGYDLMRLISEFTGNLVQLKSGTIYSDLRRIEHQGLVYSVQETSGRRRRSYVITKHGLAELRQLGQQISIRVNCVLLPLMTLINEMNE